MVHLQQQKIVSKLSNDVSCDFTDTDCILLSVVNPFADKLVTAVVVANAITAVRTRAGTVFAGTGGDGMEVLCCGDG